MIKKILKLIMQKNVLIATTIYVFSISFAIAFTYSEIHRSDYPEFLVVIDR